MDFGLSDEQVAILAMVPVGTRSPLARAGQI